jgi:hypothetical protein
MFNMILQLHPAVYTLHMGLSYLELSSFSAAGPIQAGPAGQAANIWAQQSLLHKYTYDVSVALAVLPLLI